MLWHGWLMSREIWKRMAKSIRGLQWKETLFTAVGVRVLPQLPGLYVICVTPPFASPRFKRLALHNPMYIGKTDNLSRRLGEHLDRPDKNIEQLRTQFCAELSLWYAEASIDRIETIETEMVFCFLPAANREIKIPAKVSIRGFDGPRRRKAVILKPVSANYNHKGDQP